MRKIPFAGIELTSQRVRRLHGYLSATGATGIHCRRCTLIFFPVCLCIHALYSAHSSHKRLMCTRSFAPSAPQAMSSLSQKNPHCFFPKPAKYFYTQQAFKSSKSHLFVVPRSARADREQTSRSHDRFYECLCSSFSLEYSKLAPRAAS